MIHVKVCAILLAFVLPTVASAQGGTPPPIAPSTSPTRIGIVSIQSAIVSTNDGQKNLQILEKKFDPKKIELKALGDEIESLKKQLETQGPKLNDEARASLGRQIDTKQKTLNRAREDAQNDFAEQQNEVVQKVLQKLMTIIDKYAQDSSLTLVVDASRPWPDSPVLWATPSVDITKAVVDIYNAQSAGIEPRSNGPNRQVRSDHSLQNAASPSQRSEPPK